MQEPRPTAPLILMGLRGCGKSTIGRAVADRAQGVFVDLDDVTPSFLGASSAAAAIREHGLPAFRDAEVEALEQELAAIRESRLVLALGGGTPTAPGADAILHAAVESQHATIVYLHASAEVLRDRLSATDTRTRPSLTGTDVLDEIETIYLQRDAAYRALACEVIEVGSQTPEETTALVLAMLS